MVVGELAKADPRSVQAAPAHGTVGVIISTYNRASLVTQTLDSILAQTRAPDAVVVVDDGSTDGTEKVLAGYADRIDHVRQQNAGKATALNRALSMLDTDYVWTMDDDDCALPDALERQLAFLKCHPEVDFSYSGLYFFHGDGKPPPLSQCALWQPPDIPHSVFFVRAMERYPASQLTMLVRRSCYQAIGGFDESLRFSEDYDVILRLARRYRAGRVPDPTLFVRQHSGPRGPAAETWQAEQKVAAWQAYDEKIFRKLRGDLQLHEYLPRDSIRGRLLTEVQARQALLQRSCIMARHGLFEAALNDLEQCLAAFGRGERPTPDESTICRQMLRFDVHSQPVSNQFIQDVTRLLRSRAPALLKPTLTGLYWSFRSEARARNLARTTKLGWYLAEALGSVAQGRLYGSRWRLRHAKGSPKKPGGHMPAVTPPKR